jgi:glycosyltransferase involved in cell wall biosynthesis
VRILLTSNYFPPHMGGIEFVSALLASGYRDAGHEVRWAAADVRSAPRPAQPGDVPLAAWNVTEKRFGFPYPLPSPGALAGLRKDVAWADVIHINDCLYAVSQAASWHARRAGKPVLLTQHVPPVPYPSLALRALQGAAYGALGHRLLRTSDQVVFVSRATAAAYTALKFRRPPAIVENAIDSSIFTPLDEAARASARKELGVAAGTALLLFVGRFVAKKGLQRIRVAAAELPETTWVLVGRPGEVDPSRWGLPNVRVLPARAQADLRCLYSAADLLVLPSVGEGFPLSVQESMASGTPAVVTPETAEAADGLAGLIFPAGTDLAATVRDALPAAAGRRAAVAEAALGRWSLRAMIDRYQELMEAIRK